MRKETTARAIKFFSSLATFSLIAAVLTFIPVTAASAEDNSDNPPPTFINLQSWQSYDDHSWHLSAYTDGDISQYGDGTDALQFYKVGDDTPLGDPVTSGTEADYSPQAPDSGYVQYVAKLGNLVSNRVTVYSLDNAWKVQANTDNSSFSTDDDTPQIQWSSDTPLTADAAYGIYLVNLNTQNITYKSHDAGSSGTIDIDRFFTGGAKEYMLYIANWDSGATTESDLTNIQYVSNSINIQRANWWVGVTKNQFQSNPKLIFSTNQSVFDSHSAQKNYALYVVDLTTSTILTENSDMSTDFTYEIQGLSSGTKHTYEGIIAAYTADPPTNPADLTDVQDTSEPVNATEDGWDAALTIDKTSYATDEASPVITWMTNKAINGGPYGLYIADNAGKIIYKSNSAGDTGTVTVPRAKDEYGGDYIAYLADWNPDAVTKDDLTNIDVSSNDVSYDVNYWDVQPVLETDSAGKPTAISVTVNQPVNDPYVSSPTFEMFITKVQNNDWAHPTIVAHSATMDTTYTYTLPDDGKASGTYYTVSIQDPLDDSATIDDLNSDPSYADAQIFIPYTSNDSNNNPPTWYPVYLNSSGSTIPSTADPMPTLTWNTGQPVVSTKGIYLVDTITHNIDARVQGTNVSSGTFSVNRTFSLTRSYEAYVADWSESATSSADLQNTVNNSSVPVIIQEESFKPSLSSETADAEGNAIIKLSVNQPLMTNGTEGQMYAGYLFDTTTDTLAQKYVTVDDNTTYTVPDNKIGDSFMFYVAKNMDVDPIHVSDLQNVQAQSWTVETYTLPWRVELYVSHNRFGDSYATTDPTPSFSYEAWTPLSSQGSYGLYVVDETTNNIIYKTNNIENSNDPIGTITPPRLKVSGTHIYNAYIAPWDTTAATKDDLSHIKATSSDWPVSLTYQETEASMDIESAYGVAANGVSNQMNVTVTTDMDSVYNVLDTHAYSLYLVDVSDGHVVGMAADPTNGNEYDFNIPVSEPETYKAYIAASVTSMPATSAGLTDIQQESSLPALHVNTSINATTYTSADATPEISWSANQSMGANSPKGIYILQNDGKIWYKTQDATGRAAIERSWDGSPMAYEVYSADWDPNATSMGDLKNTQLESWHDVGTINGVDYQDDGFDVQNARWSVHLTEQPATTNIDSPPVLAISTNQPVKDIYYDNQPYALYLVDDEGNIVEVNQDMSTTGTYVVSNMRIGQTERLTAIIAQYDPTATNENQLQHIVYDGGYNAVTVTDSGFQTNMTQTTQVDGSTQLQVYETASDPAIGTYSVYIVDDATDKIVSDQQLYAGPNYDNSLTDQFLVSKFYGDASRAKHFTAYVARAGNVEYLNQLVDIQSTSASVEVVPSPLTVSIATIPADDTNIDPAVQVTLSQSIADTPQYEVYIEDALTGDILDSEQPDGTTVNYTLTHFGLHQTRYLKAVVAAKTSANNKPMSVTDLTDIQVQSAATTVTASPLKLKLYATGKYHLQGGVSIFSVDFNYDDFPQFVNTGFEFYLVNTKTGQVVDRQIIQPQSFYDQYPQQWGAPYLFYAYEADGPKGTSTYALYAAATTAKADSNSPEPVQTVADMQNIAAVSNTASTDLLPFQITAESDTNVAYADVASIHIQLNEALEGSDFQWCNDGNCRGEVHTPGYYALYVEDTDTGEVWEQGKDQVWMSFEYGVYNFVTPKNFDMEHDQHYKVIVAKRNEMATTISDLSEIQTETDTITIKPLPWKISLSMEMDESGFSRTYPTGYWYPVNIASYTNEALPDSYEFNNYAAYVVDETTGKVNRQPICTQFYFNDDNDIPYDDFGYPMPQNAALYAAGNWYSDCWIGTGNYIDAGVASDINPYYDPHHRYRMYIADRPTDANGNLSYYTNKSQFQHILVESDSILPAITQPKVDVDEVAAGGDPSESCTVKCHGDPINTAIGEYYENQTDLSTKSIMPMNFERSYSSTRNNQAGDFGNGWTDNFDMQIQTYDGGNVAQSPRVTVIQENGSQIQFIRNPDGYYDTPPRVFASLTYDASNNTLVLERKTKEKFVFDGNSGRLLQEIDANGNSLTMHYNSQGQLTEVDSSNNQKLFISWNTDGHIISVKDNDNREVDYGYNTAGLLSSVTLPSSTNPIEYTYDANDRLLTYKNIEGGITKNVYNDDGQVIKQIDPYLHETDYSYDDNPDGGTITTITDPNGSVTKDYYDTNYLLDKEVQSYGTADEATTLYQYNDENQQSQVTDPEGNITKYTYDADGNKLTIVDGNGNTTKYVYDDTSGKPTSIINPDGKTSTLTYDANGNILSVKDYRGLITQFTYNSDGTVSSKTDPKYLGTTHKTLYAYDTNEYLDKVVDPDGNSTSIKNNANGTIDNSTNAKAQVTQYTYDADDRVVEQDNPNGSSVEATYDPQNGLIASTTATNGQTTSYVYDLMGRIKTKTTPLGTTTYDYDEMGNIKHEHDYAGRDTYFYYDLRNNLIKYTNADGKDTLYTYYKNDLKKTMTDPMQHETQYFYDNDGNLTMVTNAKGQNTSATYDNLNRIISSTNTSGKTIHYTYDADNNLLVEADPSEQPVSYTYDDNNNKISESTPNSISQNQVYNYDPNNNLISYTNKGGKTTTYTYDELNELKTKTYEGTTTNYGYDSVGNITSISYDNGSGVDATSKVTYQYDAGSRLIKTTKDGVDTSYNYDPTTGNLIYVGEPNASTENGSGITYDYNTANDVSSIHYKDGETVSYDYNADDQVQSVKLNNDPVVDYSYNDDGQISEEDYANGVKQNISLNELGQQTGTSITKNDASLYAEDDTLNAAGYIQKSAVTTDGATISASYTYTDSGKLSTSAINTAPAESYEFDADGNLVTTPTAANSYDPSGEITKQTTGTDQITYAYDAQGNRTKTSDQSLSTNGVNVGAPATQNYAWSIDGKLTSVSSSNSSKTVSYSYDAAGLLTNRTVTNTDSGQSDINENYVWNMNSALPLLLEDGQYSYIYGAGASPVAQVSKTDSSISYLHANYQGSIVFVTDASGAKKASYQYDAYGNLSQSSEANNGHTVTAFGYAGNYLDTLTELYNMRARWYDPNVGAFISLDPALLSTSKAYAYALGNPVMLVDLTGLFAGMTDTQKTIAEYGILALGLVVGAAACIGTAGIGCAIAAGAIIGAITGAADYAVQSNCPTLIKALKAGGLGALSGAAGGVIGGGLSGKLASSMEDMYLTDTVTDFSFTQTSVFFSDGSAFTASRLSITSTAVTAPMFSKAFTKVTEKTVDTAIEGGFDSLTSKGREKLLDPEADG